MFECCLNAEKVWIRALELDTLRMGGVAKLYAFFGPLNLPLHIELVAE